MRILLMSAAAAAALSVAPATAQSYPQNYSGGYGGGYARTAVPQPWQVRSMIDTAEQRGEISSDEANDLRDQANDLVRLDRRVQRDDGNGDARRDLNRRTFAILRELREARAGANGDYADRGDPRGYARSYPSAPSGNYDAGRPVPDDDDQPYAPPPPSGSDRYQPAPPPSDPYSAPAPYDPNRAAPPNDDPYRAAPPATDPYRAAPPPSDDRSYDDPNAPGDDGPPPPPPPNNGNYQSQSY